MNKYTEMLNLNVEDVENLGDTYAGYAAALAEQGSVDRLPIVASSWLIGGLFQSITAPKRALESFTRASGIFRQLNWPLWRICEICSLTLPNIETFRNGEGVVTTTAEEAFYMSLQLSFFLTEHDNRRPDLSDGQEEQFPMGRIENLGIPYRFVLAAIVEIDGINSKINNRIENLPRLFERLQEVSEQYQSDEYHWQYLEGPVLPFEPVTLAIFIVLVKKWLQYRNINELISLAERQGNQQSVLVHIAYDLIKERFKINPDIY